MHKYVFTIDDSTPNRKNVELEGKTYQLNAFHVMGGIMHKIDNGKRVYLNPKTGHFGVESNDQMEARIKSV